ncbi:unnamed protein product [Tuber melanosporum]|uniref:(Perigord truffle) hypothetical protein n=1 Tax=Tuber melanosporum (strain Mel28) TaxID=656061 RepID=D5GC81_TUBMM|nr:uncharacterized protein GSTUM_00000633001 [Tuber melanosporum]CAZ82124.1 unnamed protein product [Tuber melanosporum]
MMKPGPRGLGNIDQGRASHPAGYQLGVTGSGDECQSSALYLFMARVGTWLYISTAGKISGPR